MIQGHGNNTSQHTELTADFSSNVWYQPISEELIAVLTKSIHTIKNYPEPDAFQLKNAIARHFDMKEQNILITNGSTEAFYLIAQAFACHHSIIIYPSFAEYEDACRLYHHQINYEQNTLGWQNNIYSNKLVWFANPNNPDGKTLTLNEIELLVSSNPSSVFVLDEAYLELCYDATSALSLLAKYSNLIIVKSFTKTFSIPGLRLGYMLSSELNINLIKPFIMPWNINSLALTAGLFITKHYHALLPDKKIIKHETIQFQEALKATGRLKVYPSNCNFILVQMQFGKALELKTFLLREYNLLIRDASNFKGLDTSFFRVAIQKPTHNQLLINGIKKWTKA